jgi:hypothetical protein
LSMAEEVCVVRSAGCRRTLAAAVLALGVVGGVAGCNSSGGASHPPGVDKAKLVVKLENDPEFANPGKALAECYADIFTRFAPVAAINRYVAGNAAGVPIPAKDKAKAVSAIAKCRHNG